MRVRFAQRLQVEAFPAMFLNRRIEFVQALGDAFALVFVIFLDRFKRCLLLFSIIGEIIHMTLEQGVHLVVKENALIIGANLDHR